MAEEFDESDVSKPTLEELAAMSKGERCDWLYQSCPHGSKPQEDACDVCTEDRLARLSRADRIEGELKALRWGSTILRKVVTGVYVRALSKGRWVNADAVHLEEDSFKRFVLNSLNKVGGVVQFVPERDETYYVDAAHDWHYEEEPPDDAA